MADIIIKSALTCHPATITHSIINNSRSFFPLDGLHLASEEIVMFNARITSVPTVPVHPQGNTRQHFIIGLYIHIIQSVTWDGKSRRRPCPEAEKCALILRWMSVKCRPGGSERTRSRPDDINDSTAASVTKQTGQRPRATESVSRVTNEEICHSPELCLTRTLARRQRFGPQELNGSVCN